MTQVRFVFFACLAFYSAFAQVAFAQQLAAPTDVQATAASSSSINLTWKASPSAVSYSVFRSKTAGFVASDNDLIKAGVNGTSFADTGLTPGTTYYYSVKAADKSNNSSEASKVVSATTQPASSSLPSWSSLYTRAVAGLSVAGGTSLATQPQAFVEFNLTAPFPYERRDPSKDSERAAASNCVEALDFLSESLKPAAGRDPVAPTTEQLKVIKDACGDPSAQPADNKYDAELKKKGVADIQWDALYKATTAQAFESAAAAVRRNYAVDYSPIARRTWFWLNPRITSSPTQVSNLLTTVATPSPTFNSLLAGQYNQIVQDFSTVGGIEVFPLKPRKWVNLGADTRLGFAFIAGAGFHTPLSATANNAQIFTIPIPASPSLISQLQQNGVPVSNLCVTSGLPLNPPGCTNAVAFVPLQRTRFFYQDYFGLRFSTFYFKTASQTSQFGGLCDNRASGELCPIFPGTFAISIGQNSAYTGGAMHGWLLKTEVFYPLPFYPTLHLFFSSWINVTEGNKSQPPLLLDAAGTSVTVTSPGVEVVPLPPFNRDYYRIGVGLDLVQLVKSLAKASSGGSASTTSPAASQKPTKS